MQLERARIRNFKLLEDVEVEFSIDPSRPLTIIRAENGSGKTSLLWALLWAFYGEEGLPRNTQRLRLTSSAAAVNSPIEVQVAVDFVRNDSGIKEKYQLIRTVQETPRGKDVIDRGPTKARLMRRTASGFEDVLGDAEAVIAKFLPIRLKSVFFTDGDDVQRFISGDSALGRQTRVHEAIKALLGLDSMRMAKEDLESVVSRLRKDAASSAGADLKEKESNLAKLQEDLKVNETKLEELTERRNAISNNKTKAERELSEIRGIGDIDSLNEQLRLRESELSTLEKNDLDIQEKMRGALNSEGAAWSLARVKLLQGYTILDGLADRGVIPGTSIEVLSDRLHLNECICGADLSEGQPARVRVEGLREEQRRISEARGRQTATFHAARIGRLAFERECESGSDFRTLRTSLLREYAENRHHIRAKGGEIAELKRRRNSIDAEQVQVLLDRVNNAEAKFAAVSEEIGQLNQIIIGQTESCAVAKEAYEKAEKLSRVSGQIRAQREVADDLRKLLAGTISVLESESIREVSKRMNSMFLKIVGSDPDSAGAVFRGVRITESFDIVIDTFGEGHLDPDFEVNGASQRALTLSFIWALMEVSGQVAPRIIDTPLGMTAGGVKRRMVEAITEIQGGEGPDFQVVLLLTRSEIRDIESLLSARAGKAQTLSCNKDYPTDLVNDWSEDHPLVLRCSCSHTQFCRVCARRYDEDHGLTAREI